MGWGGVGSPKGLFVSRGDMASGGSSESVGPTGGERLRAAALTR